MSQRNLRLRVLIADLLWSFAAMGIAVTLRYGPYWSGVDADAASQLFHFLAAAIFIWALFSFVVPIDGFRGGWRVSAVVSQLLLAVSALMLILLSGGYLVRSYVSRLALVHFGVLLFAGFVVLRVSFYVLLRARFRNGGVRRVVIVGSGPMARELVRKVDRHPEMLCRVVGLLAPDDGSFSLPAGTVAANSPRPTSTLEVVDLLLDQGIDEVILALDECSSPDLLNLTARCRAAGIKVSLVPQFCELYLSRFHLHDLDGLPLLQLAAPGLSFPAVLGKRVLDLVLGALLLLGSLPVLVPLALILHFSKGRALRWEMRCGLHGKEFAMLRLNIDRTPYNKSSFERVLRDLSLTELPQLWNVLRGEMSLVGPRPESRDRVWRYSEWQQQRLSVKPGMTGLAQVQGLREQHSSEDKTRFDLQYLLNCSLWTDLSLLLQTLWTLATRSCARSDSADYVPLEPYVDGVVHVPMQEEVLEHVNRS